MIRRALKLSEFNMEWEHRPGVQNVVADVLYRNPVVEGKRVTVNIDQVRVYRPRQSDTISSGSHVETLYERQKSSNGSSRSHPGKSKRSRKTSSEESKGRKSNKGNAGWEDPRLKRKVGSNGSVGTKDKKRSKMCRKRSLQGSEHRDQKRPTPEPTQEIKRTIPSSVLTQKYKYRRPNNPSQGSQSIASPSHQIDTRQGKPPTEGSRQERSGQYDKARETRTTTCGTNRSAERRPVRSKQATANRKETTIEERKLVIKLSNEGKSQRNIAKVVGRSVNCIQKLKKTGMLANNEGRGRKKIMNFITERRVVIHQVKIDPKIRAPKIAAKHSYTLGRSVSAETQDNDPKHTAFVVKEWLLYHCRNQLNTPPQSPDLNVIENLWSHLERAVQKHQITIKEQLKSVLQEEWLNIAPETTRHLVESMPRRLEAVISAKGYATKY
ncbi:transposable element Tcb2 transposase [Trichonephila clavipes]|nr:transposable element Tcb2 transposase [Trichonephila clavipes]